MAQDIIISNNQWSGVPFVDFDKVGGGTATYFDSRTVTYNLSGGASVSANPSNAIAGQGFSLKLKAPAGYNLSNVSVTMGGVDITSQVFTPDEAGGGGSSVQTQSGTFTGGGGNTATISCNFAPCVIYIHGDLSQDPSLRGIVSIELVKDMYIAVTADSSTSAYSEYLLYLAHGISDYSTDTDNPYATYSNGTLTIDTVYNSGSARWASGITYNYELIGW